MKAIPTYEADNGDTIQFRRVISTPGFSHRVILNRHAVDWLGDHQRPSAKTAAFFLAKHGRKASLGEILLGSVICQECGVYPADYPSRICPGCEAYHEHTA